MVPADGHDDRMIFGWSSKVPFVGEALDRISRDGDKDLDLMLTDLKAAIGS